MGRYVVEVGPADEYYWYDDEWKDNVCADFDENVVIVGDYYHDSIAEASWWKDAKEVIDSAYHSSDLEDFLSYYGREYSADKAETIYDMVQEAYDEEDPEFIMQIAQVLDPWLKLEYTSIRNDRGSVDVIYVADELDEHALEDWYAGNVYEVFLYDVSDIEFDEDADDQDWENIVKYESPEETVAITDTEYWNLPRVHGDPDFTEFFGLPKDSEVIVIEGE